MNVLDLFAGAGGLSEGFRRNGFNIIAHVEKDLNASLTLKTREAFWFLKTNNKIKIYEDYLKGLIDRETLYNYIPESILNRVLNIEINDDNLNIIFNNIKKNMNNQKIDVIIGGPPCQAYSVVGRSRDPNKMKNDERNYLYLKYLKFVEEFNPKFLIFENVAGLLSAKKGKIFLDIQERLRNLGYEIHSKLYNSNDFGVLQLRKRIIIIGWKKEENLNILNLKFNKNNWIIKDLFLDLPELSNDSEANFYNDKDNQKCLNELKIKTNNWNINTYHISRKNNQRDLNIYKICVETLNEKKKKLKYNQLPKELITHNNHLTFLDRFSVVPYDSICHTMVAHIAKDGHYYIHPDLKQNRSLTVREAARIQSFPDDYFFENSRTAAFTQIGNAVPPLVAEAFAKLIYDCINNK